MGVIGLGYVGLPLAIEFGKMYSTIGFDISKEKVELYKKHIDATGQIAEHDFVESKFLSFSCKPIELSQQDVVVIAVPTPVDKFRKPDFTPLLSACELLGPNLKPGAVVVFESTVYPGATEEVCIPALERSSDMVWKTDFFVGYSPERINPGDEERTLTKIIKVVSADTPNTLDVVASLYSSIITAGVYQASSIRVAEAAKVIENTQRDLNIALINELAIIFGRMEIDTQEVLRTASTKWNFLPFKPGMVGGHCIGVDPYYLTHKAEQLGYHPEIILAGRRINDSMGVYIANQIVKKMIGAAIPILNSNVLVLGITFKENCSDIRNSKVVDLIAELQEYGCTTFVEDPRADAIQTEKEYGIKLAHIDDVPLNLDAIILAVPHKEYLINPEEKIFKYLKPGGVFGDVKSAIDPSEVSRKKFVGWRL